MAKIEMTAGNMEQWSRRRGVSEAISGGFFVHKHTASSEERLGDPLGEVWIDDKRETKIPFAHPWDKTRGVIALKDEQIHITSFASIEKGDASSLLQAGPVLLQDSCLVDFEPEGFGQEPLRFNNDITAERHPRAAIGVSRDSIFLFACDGRQEDESGMLLEEVGEFLLQAGAEQALNLDGGESVSFFHAGKLQNVPVGEESRRAYDPKRIITPTAIALYMK